MTKIDELESMTREQLHDYAVNFKKRMYQTEVAEHGENSPQAKSVKEMSIETIKASLLLRPITEK